MSAEILMQAGSLCFSYSQGRTVLSDLNLEVRRGEKLAIIGRNGSGKTTLFHLLMGLQRPSNGQILLHGEPVGYSRKSLLHWRQMVSMVFQDPDDQLFAPTIEQDVSFGPINLGLNHQQVEERVTAALRAMNIESLGERSPLQLSGGEKKRAAIAGALAMQPEILLLDEPTAGLDLETHEQLRDALDTLHQSQVAVVVSTHDLNFAWQWATRLLILHQGRVLAVGAARQLLLNRELLESAGLRQPPLAHLAAMLNTADWRSTSHLAQQLCHEIEQWTHTEHPSRPRTKPTCS